MTTPSEHLTVSALSLQLGVPEHTIRRAVREGVITRSTAGRVSFFSAADLDAIRAALAGAGYLPVPTLGDGAHPALSTGLM